MEFGAVSGVVNPNQMLRARYSQGKISLPVAPSHSLYARFEHVRGIPSESGRGSVAINRLMVLNSLIEGLSSRKESPSFGIMPEESSRRMDLLAKQYSEQIHRAVNAQPAFFSRMTSADSGMLVNLVA